MAVLPILLYSACFVVVALYIHFKWQNRRVIEAASKLPGPTPLPIIGNCLDLLGDLRHFHEKLSKLAIEFEGLFCFWLRPCPIIVVTNPTDYAFYYFYEKISQMAIEFKGMFCVWLGPCPMIVVTNPTDSKIILNSSNMLSKEISYQFIVPYLGEGLLTAPVPLWKRYRRLLSPVMHPSNIEHYIPQFNNVSWNIITDLEKKWGKGLIDPKDIIYSNIVDAASETIFGGASLGKTFKDHLLFVMEWSGSVGPARLINPAYYVDFVFNIFNWRKEKLARRCVCTLTSEFNQIIQFFQEKERSEEENSSNSGKSILDVMADTGTLDDSHWKDELITFAVTATDTMVSAIYFLLASLAINQEVQDKVYSEIQKVVGPCKGDFNLRDLNSLTYLGHAITESMRLHGVAPLIGREVTKDTKLSEFTLPAGSRVVIFLQALGQDPEVFPEPHRYNPDRFINEENHEGRLLMSYILPFSAGPRNCIGKVYALHLIKIITARVISKYKLVLT